MAVRSLWNEGKFLLIAGTLSALLGLAAGSARAATVTAHVTTQTGAPAENAVVSVERTGQGAATAKAGTRATMIQQDRQFTPTVLPVQVGTTVDFPNRDPFRHQVYSFSPAKTFELKLYGGDDVQHVTFDKQGVVPLGCNIHDNMRAYIYVIGTPYFAVADKSGTANVAEVPAGSYTVKVWHPGEKTGEAISKDVTLTANDDAVVNLKIDIKRDRTQKKPGAVDDKAY